ncbi:YceI family protein [Flammeovirga pectinis]|uniref:YceI family protein n=1 Tax=Flammeovirga pectinis TaxID=2494373 RepID=A0A3Q9FJP9_9BACT|nr:YceI family protein [Flammeovirga pectinis]AZQ61668.1 YceI family protein [Flammeovirga pectinis]
MKQNLNILFAFLFLIGMISCGEQKSSTEHQEEGHSHDHGHSHKHDEVKLSDGTYKVDTQKSFIKWTGKKVTGEHFGKMMLKEGAVIIKNGTVAKGSSFDMDVTTLTVDDIPVDDSMNAKLKGHLHSADFFNAAEFPFVNFAVTKVENGEHSGELKVTGNLTIKGITNSITFPAQLMSHDGTMHAIADITFDRTKFEIKYGSGSFFEGLGDKTISDDVELELQLFAKK